MACQLARLNQSIKADKYEIKSWYGRPLFHMCLDPIGGGGGGETTTQTTTTTTTVTVTTTLPPQCLCVFDVDRTLTGCSCRLWKVSA